ncbi:MAG: ribosome-associated translation inhibitor RaiA [Elusimicrobia bacterium]|nr:ribosome-associated translation inhibitor RaiA [Candidatus Obscuribacterium magneticum]
MFVHIKGHQTDVLSRWREHIYERLTKLDRFEDRIIKLEITLTASHHHLKGNESCHITAKVPRKTIAIKRNGETMFEAIDAASRILEKQIHDLWKDVRDRRRRVKGKEEGKGSSRDMRHFS